MESFACMDPFIVVCEYISCVDAISLITTNRYLYENNYKKIGRKYMIG